MKRSLVSQDIRLSCLGRAVQLSPLRFAMLVCIFPFVGMFNLFFMDSLSYPLATRGVYIISLALWASFIFNKPGKLAPLSNIDWLPLLFSSASREPDRRSLSVPLGLLVVYLFSYNMVQGQLASFRSLPLFLILGFASAVAAGNMRYSSLAI